jgi:hypothetical protein
MAWWVVSALFIALDTKLDIRVTCGRHRSTRYVMRKICLEAVSEMTVVCVLCIVFSIPVVSTKHHSCVTVTLTSYSGCPRFKS